MCSVLDVPGQPKAARPYFVVSGKALSRHTPHMGGILSEMLEQPRLDNIPRITQRLRQVKAGHESGLVSGGHSYAAGLLASQHSKGAWLGELFGGLSSLYTARTLLDCAAAAATVGGSRASSSSSRVAGGSGGGGLDALVADLETMRDILLTRSNVLMSATGDAATLRGMESTLRGVVGGLRSDGFTAAAPSPFSLHTRGSSTAAAVSRPGPAPWSWPGDPSPSSAAPSAHAAAAAAAHGHVPWSWPGASAAASAASSASASAAHAATHGHAHFSPFAYPPLQSLVTAVSGRGASQLQHGGSSVVSQSLPHWPIHVLAGASAAPDGAAPPNVALAVPTQVCYVCMCYL